MSLLVRHRCFLVELFQDIEQLYTLTFRKTESNRVEQQFPSKCGQMLLLSRQIADKKVVFYGSKFGEFSSLNIFHLLYLLNPFCSLDSCASYHGLIRSKMTLMISLHTVDLMLSPLYLLVSDFDPFPFQSVLSLELPQTAGISRFDHRLFAILSIIWSISRCSHCFSSSGSTSLLAFPDFNWRRCLVLQWLVLHD